MTVGSELEGVLFPMDQSTAASFISIEPTKCVEVTYTYVELNPLVATMLTTF